MTTRKQRAKKPAAKIRQPKPKRSPKAPPPARKQKQPSPLPARKVTRALKLTVPEPGLSPKQRAFLAAFRGTASITRAAKAARIDRWRHYWWIEDPRYARAFERAREEAAQVLEDEAVRRAYEGMKKPVFYMGERVDVVFEYSDSLLMFLLKGWRPERYRDRMEHSGKDGGPIEVDITERLNAGRNRIALVKPHAA